MIAVDTNVLIYAHREETEWHAAAVERLVTLAEGDDPWVLPVLHYRVPARGDAPAGVPPTLDQR